MQRVPAHLTAVAVVSACLLGVLPAISHALVLHEGSAGPAAHPPDAAVGCWAGNASCVAVGPNVVMTTCHQGYGVGWTVEIGGQTFTIAEVIQHGEADLRLARLVDPEDPGAALDLYLPPYTGTDEDDHTAVLGGFGDGRGADLVSGTIHYGYAWQPDADLVLRWGENAVEGSGTGSGPGFASQVIYAYFDGPGASAAEAATAEHDSGGGWFINRGTAADPEWVVAGLTRGVAHWDESWFQQPSGNPPGDYIDAVRVSAYAGWINGVLHPHEWAANADGDWSDADNWSDDGYWAGAYPTGADRWAVLADAITDARTVTLDENVTLGVLRIDAGQPYRLAGTHTLTLRSDDNTVVSIEVNPGNTRDGNGAHRLEVPIRLKDPLVLNQGSSGALTLAGPIDDWLAFACDVTKRGDGEVVLAGNNSGLSGDITVERGVLSAAHPLALGGGQVFLAGGDLHLLADADTAFASPVKVTDDATLLAAPVTAGADATLSLGSLTLLAPGGGLTLTTAGTDGYGLAVVGLTVCSDEVTVHTGSVDLRLAGGVQLATGTLTKTGPGTLTVAGGQSYGQGTTVAVAGGTVRFNTDAGDGGTRPLTVEVDGGAAAFASTQHLAGLNLLDGEAVCLAHGGRTLVTGGLQIAETAPAPDALLDLADNNLMVDYAATSPYNRVEGWIKDAYHEGAWDGPGITSSHADADDYALGVADTADGDFTPPDDLEGEPFDDSAVLVKFTFYADADLDGQVGTKDVTALINGWNGAYTGDPRWTVGDFNYDGQIGTKDVNKLINSWNAHSGETAGVGAAVEPDAGLAEGVVAASAAEASAPPAVHVAPEPGSFVLAALGALGLWRRRRGGERHRSGAGARPS